MYPSYTSISSLYRHMTVYDGICRDIMLSGFQMLVRIIEFSMYIICTIHNVFKLYMYVHSMNHVQFFDESMY